MIFTLKSSAFADGGMIPSKYTCDGDNISPPVSWINPPSGTHTYALIVDDPDAPAGVWDHWLLFNIPERTHELPEDFIAGDIILCGLNSWGDSSYGGPCPPDGEHRYFFKLYALDTKLDLVNPDKAALEDAMRGHILASATLMGKYRRIK
ncbi:MAG TPA: YbhB/YbcL family Raf kinase inhibitor-like protein [Gammaproteobacteria bacterium]|nr:YbhB/YbcL family Raf kinase inhibitor-like protein [Gammaproteobacteria bacterium]